MKTGNDCKPQHTETNADLWSQEGNYFAAKQAEAQIPDVLSPVADKSKMNIIFKHVFAFR